jgi:Mg-chelatase subunit ChlD
VVKGLPLTDNLARVKVYLDQIQAQGGGDEPEAVYQGLQWSIENNKFRPRARKVILLFGDAPPHAEQNVLCQKIASDFRKNGGIVSTVTCRSEFVLEEFEAIAKIGGGEAFLTTSEREIMTQLMVLVFGSQHRSKVVEAFDLLNK